MSVAINYSGNPRFDIVEYIKKLRNAGVSQEVAEIQGQEIERVIEFTVNNAKAELNAKDLATKSDIRESELRLQKEIVTIKMELEVKIKNAEIKLMFLYGTGFLVLLGVLAKGFHWL